MWRPRMNNIVTVVYISLTLPVLETNSGRWPALLNTCQNDDLLSDYHSLQTHTLLIRADFHLLSAPHVHPSCKSVDKSISISLKMFQPHVVCDIIQMTQRFQRHNSSDHWEWRWTHLSSNCWFSHFLIKLEHLSDGTARWGTHMMWGHDCIGVLTAAIVLVFAELSMCLTASVTSGGHMCSEPGCTEARAQNSSGGHFMQDWDCWINLAACQSFLITGVACWCNLPLLIFLFRTKSLGWTERWSS